MIFFSLGGRHPWMLVRKVSVMPGSESTGNDKFRDFRIFEVIPDSGKQLDRKLVQFFNLTSMLQNFSEASV
jgi:hypothetical protein